MADLSWWLDQVGRYPLLTPAEEIELGTAIQRWRTHDDGPDRCPPGIRRRGQRARERFIQANLKLAVHWVNQHCHRLARTGSIDDLVQAANLGLITAVERFDPTRGYRFSTYAYWWIRQSVQSYCDKLGRVVAIPGQHHQHLSKLGPTRQRLELELGRSPTRQELADAMGISTVVLDAVLVNAQPISSLDVVIDAESGSDLGDMLPSHDATLEELEEQEARLRQAEQLRNMIRRLPRRDRTALSQAWGLDGVQTTRRELAQQLGMSMRRLAGYLTSLERQLQSMAIQLVLVAVPPVELQPQPRMRRRRRLRIVDGQLSLALAAA